LSSFHPFFVFENSYWVEAIYRFREPRNANHCKDEEVLANSFAFHLHCFTLLHEHKIEEAMFRKVNELNAELF